MDFSTLNYVVRQQMNIPRSFSLQMLTELPKSLIQRTLRLWGLEIHRSSDLRAAEAPAQVISDPQEALHLLRAGVPAHYRCPIENLVRLNGWQFGAANWNPFSAVAKKLLEAPQGKYNGSILERYYSYHQPGNAAEAVIGLEHTACQLAKLEPLMVYMTPWESASESEVHRQLMSAFRADLKEHYGPRNLSFEQHGWKDHGPVSPVFGEFEFQRIRNVVLSAKSQGYIQNGSGVRVWVLRREHDYRFLIRGGMHRAAVADAMDLEYLLVSFVRPWVIGSDEVAYWPGVKNGLWTRTEALRYFDHLFDFESYNWAYSAHLV